MLQAWLVVSPPSNFYTYSTVLFHKNGWANFAVTNCMSHFSMFVPTKSTVKLANINTGHAQGIGIILFHFTNCSIIYPVVPVYYCPCYPFNTVSSGDLKVYSGFQKVASESLEHCDFVDLQGSSWRSPYQTHNNLNNLQIDIVKVSPQRDRNIVVPTFCSPFKNNLSQLSAKTDAAEKRPYLW